MSQITRQAEENAMAATEQCRTLLAMGPAITPEILYQTGELLRLTGSAMLGLLEQLKAEQAKQSAAPGKPESPALADLFGR